MIATGLILLFLAWLYTFLRRPHLTLVALNSNFFDGWDLALLVCLIGGAGLVVAGLVRLAWAYLP